MKKFLYIFIVLTFVVKTDAAWQMEYTDERDNTYPNSYWIPAQININPVEKIAYVVFLGYKNGNANSLRKYPIGQKTYVITSIPDRNTGTNYWNKYFRANNIEGAGVGPYINAYALSREIKDNGLKAGYTFDGTTYRDGNGNVVTFAQANQSFFEVAVSAP